MKSKGNNVLSVYSLTNQQPRKLPLTAKRLWIFIISDNCIDKLQEAYYICSETHCIGIYVGKDLNHAKEKGSEYNMKMYWSGGNEVSQHLRDSLEIEDCPWYVCFYRGTMIYSWSSLPEKIVHNKLRERPNIPSTLTHIDSQGILNEPAPEEDYMSPEARNKNKKQQSRGEAKSLNRQVYSVDRYNNSNRNELRNTSNLSLANLQKTLKKEQESSIKVPQSERRVLSSYESSSDESEGVTVRAVEVVAPKIGVKPNPLTRRQFVDINEMISRSQRTLDRIPSRPKTRNVGTSGLGLGFRV